MEHLDRWEKPITEVCGVHDDDIVIMQEPPARKAKQHLDDDEVFVDYNKSFFRTKALKYWAEKYLKALPSEVTHLVCRGASGTSIASAMVVMSDRELKTLIVRKEGENAHSCAIGGYTGCTYMANIVCAIVDDFVASGETVNAILKAVKRYSSLNVKYLIAHGDVSAYRHNFRNLEGKLLNCINVANFK